MSPRLRLATATVPADAGLDVPAAADAAALRPLLLPHAAVTSARDARTVAATSVRLRAIMLVPPELARRLHRSLTIPPDRRRGTCRHRRRTRRDAGTRIRGARLGRS